MEESITYPIRINRYLLLKGYCSRRKADGFIKQGQVKINGRVAVLGDKIQKGDVVVIGKLLQKDQKKRVYYAFYKPKGIVTHNPREDEKSIDDIFKTKEPVFPFGRLDKDSHGLMLLSNDGRIVDRLLSPQYEHEKEYIVSVDKPLKERIAKRMSRGLWLENFQAKPCTVNILSPRTMRIILTEGKRHQIRRMCAAVGYQVCDLKRIRIMNIRLGTLKEGEAREITEKELEIFFNKIGFID
ncbi:MAG: pseudouridine synthase [bacterium]